MKAFEDINKPDLILKVGFFNEYCVIDVTDIEHLNRPSRCVELVIVTSTC